MVEKLIQIQFLGQAGILLKNEKTTIIIDPYLSNYVVTGGYGSAELFSRKFPPPVQPENLPAINAVFITHDHADHCDLDSLSVIAANNPLCVFIGPKPVRDHLSQMNNFHNQILVPHANFTFVDESIPFEYHSLPSAHYDFEVNATSGEYDYLGYLIRVEDFVLYHSGDTILYDGMVENILKPGWKIDIACLPVNGRDRKREQLGIVGNLNVQESVELAKAIKAKVLIPIHNDLFTINQENPEYVNTTLGMVIEVKIWQMAHGETFSYKN